MKVIKYLREVISDFMNKEVGQFESDSEDVVEPYNTTNLLKYPKFLDLTILGRKYKSETFIPEKQDSWIPPNPTQSYHSDRMKTFEKWPKQIEQLPEHLARAGFYYTKQGDTVQCFYCGLILFNWEKGDNVICEHRRHCNTCKFIHMVYGS